MTLNSLLSQTLQDYEVIVIDDCSTDHSVEIVESMSKSFNGKLQLIKLPVNNGEAGTPRNVGLSKAIGRYVYFLDSDDLLTADAFEKLYIDAEKYNADVLHGSRLYTFSGDGEVFESNVNVRGVERDMPLFYPYDIEKRVLDFLAWRFSNVVWNKFFRRSMLVDNEIVFPPTFSVEDVFFMLQVACCANVYCKPPGVHFYHRFRAGSLVSNPYPTDKFIEKQIKTIEIIFDMLNNFTSKHKIFEARPELKYRLCKYFLEYHVQFISRMRPHYENNSAAFLNGIILEIISEGVNFSSELIAIILTNVEFQPDGLLDRERQIERLQLELKRLNT